MFDFIRIRDMTSSDIQKRLGENLRQIRKERNLTQFQLAEMAEVSEETIKNIELSRCWTSDEKLSKITDALNIDVCHLFLPVGSSFNKNSDESRKIKEAIAENVISYVESVLDDVIKK